jgi:hypothetical protein
MNILAGADRSTTLLKFSHHANLSTAGADGHGLKFKG